LKQQILNEIPLFGACRFGAESADLDPKVYFVLREGESGGSKQNSTGWKKNGVFHPKNKANCEDITKEMLCGNTAPLFVCGYAQM
jgi:hypothetical protein